MKNIEVPLEYRTDPVYVHMEVEDALRTVLSGPYPLLQCRMVEGQPRLELLDEDGDCIMWSDSLGGLVTMVLRQKVEIG